MKILSPSAERFPVLALLKKTPWQVVSRLSEGKEERVGRLVLLPPGGSEVALLEGISALEKRLKDLSIVGVPRFRKVVEGLGGTWMLFDYKPGILLSQYIHMEPRIPTTWILWWVRLLLEALDGLHCHGLTVGHVEPSDVLLRGDRLWLLDIGLFENVFPALAVFPNHPFGHFVAPEKRSAPVSNAATDVYSVGALAFWLLTARAPVSDDAQLIRDALARRRSDVPSVVASLVADMLARDPRQRPPSAADALERLVPFVTDMTGDEPPLPLLGAGHLDAAVVTAPISMPPEPVTQADVKPAPQPPVPAPPRIRVPVAWMVVALGLIVAGLSWHPHVVERASAPTTPGRAPTVAQLSDQEQILQHLGAEDSGVVGGAEVSVPIHRSSLSLGPGTRIGKPHWDGGEFDFELDSGDVRLLTTTGDRLVVTCLGMVITVQGNCQAILQVASSQATVTCKMGAVLVASHDTRIVIPAGHSRSF
ncbi:MAG TPA: hypothetical protein VGO93_32095 [Candidatus Xenobia bacterium]|jgi:serine/threonine protein kinase